MRRLDDDEDDDIDEDEDEDIDDDDDMEGGLLGISGFEFFDES
jgi:hypothetical protein